MPLHHLVRFCAGMAISSARRNRQPVTQGAIIIQHNQTNLPPPPPGTGYLPGYQPFTNQPTTVVYNPQPNVIQVGNVRPDSYMVIAILATFFCFFPFGIVGIVYASQVDSAYENGDYLRAQSSSTYAKSWTIASCITGIVIFSFIGLYVFLAVLNRPTNEDY